jgi:hypothetical protein
MCSVSKKGDSLQLHQLYRDVPAKGDTQKQYLSRPAQALMVPGGWRSQISRHSAYEGGEVVISEHGRKER